MYKHTFKMEDVEDVIHPEYSSHLQSMMKTYMNSDDYRDVTLVCADEQMVSANKWIISSYSSILQNLFFDPTFQVSNIILKKQTNEHTIVILKHLQKKYVQMVLEFMYLGKVAIERSHVYKLLEVAKKLDIKYLVTALNAFEKKKNIDEDEDISHGISEELVDSKDQFNIMEGDWKKEFMIEVNQKRYEQKTCQECGKSVANLYKHKKLHLSQQWSCDKCDSKFRQRDSLKRHVDYVHGGIRIMCEHCPYSAQEKRYVQKHVLKKHPNISFTEMKYKKINFPRQDIFLGSNDQKRHSAIVEKFKALIDK